jgi:hypothetical protein
MLVLLSLAIVFALAVAVTVYAVVHAQEGFEDEQGFHAVSRSVPQNGIEKPRTESTTPLAAA